jgi:hypothetical protein
MEEARGSNPLISTQIALIAQWIERIRPKDTIWVRFLVRAHPKNFKNQISKIKIIHLVGGFYIFNL